jgi:hypothetical protein
MRNTLLVFVLGAISVLCMVSCNNSGNTDAEVVANDTAITTTAPAPIPEPAKEREKWVSKADFIAECLASGGMQNMSNGDTTKARYMCTCMADKVEAKYPDGLSFKAAGEQNTFQEIGASYCFKRH